MSRKVVGLWLYGKFFFERVKTDCKRMRKFWK